jgi:hypothetical protein
MKNDSMLEALRRKKSNTVTITLELPEGVELGGMGSAGPSEGLMGLEGEGVEGEMHEKDEQERRELDMAPPATPLDDENPGEALNAEHPDEEQDLKLIESALGKANFGKNSILGKMRSKPVV